MNGGSENTSIAGLCIRLAGALGAFAITCLTLIIVLALFGRDLGLNSFLDQWFSDWSELKLTVVGAVMLGGSALALKAVRKGEARHRDANRFATRHDKE